MEREYWKVYGGIKAYLLLTIFCKASTKQQGMACAWFTLQAHRNSSLNNRG